MLDDITYEQKSKMRAILFSPNTISLLIFASIPCKLLEQVSQQNSYQTNAFETCFY